MENNFFDHNYHLNKQFLLHIGVWPEQTLTTRIVVPSCLIVAQLSILIPLGKRMIDVWGDFGEIMEPLPAVLLITVSTALLINTEVKGKSTIELIKRIEYAWESVTAKPPVTAILERYALDGRKFTILHAALFWSNALAFIIMPLTPLMLDVVAPLNESRPMKYVFSAEYGIDQDKYYFWILLHACVATYACIVIFVVVDTIYSSWVQHCCALFEMTGYYLKNAIETFRLDSNIANMIKSPNGSIYANLCFCIREHNDAILFANAVESIYSMVNAYVLGIFTLLLSLSGVILLLEMNNPEKAVRYAVIICTVIYRLYHSTYFGQKLIDHSIRIGQYAYDCDWCTLSPREQKLLLLIVARAQRPCFHTAGKVYLLNMENFSTVIKTSFSYFTMLSSFR